MKSLRLFGVPHTVHVQEFRLITLEDELVHGNIGSSQLRMKDNRVVPHRSPFRYPDGKTWLVPRMRAWLQSLPAKPREFAEPFAGGAIVGLSAVFEDLVERLILVEMDEDVAAVWQVLLTGDAEKLGLASSTSTSPWSP